VEALISKHQQAIDKIDAEIEEAEDAAGLAPPSAALLSKKQRALELQIKLAQDKIRRVELQLRTAATAEEKATLQQEKATLQQEKATLQQEKILLLKAQERAQQPSAASGECALCLHAVALMAAMAVTSMRQLLPGSER
jgi:predicted  nucleic acid-binding Zn-ribbon protein